jgi:quercetin dioxygenase-like cupin family protein
MMGVLIALTAFAALAFSQTQSTGILITPVLDNPTVSVNRLRMEADSGESVHTHPFGLLVVLLTDADVERTLAGKTSRTHETAGNVWFAPKDVPHASRNAGKTPIEAIAIAVKPTRPSAPSAPATVAPPGITRTTLLDNDEVRVVRVQFTTEGREPVHTHPNDLLTIQLTAGRMEMAIGSDKTTSGHGAGFLQFVPRNVQHAYASADTKPLELISVAIK